MKRTASSTPLTDQLEGALQDIREGDVRALPAPPVLPPVPAFTAAEARARRASLNMTRSEFADLLQVATKTVQAWEAGRRVASATRSRPVTISETVGEDGRPLTPAPTRSAALRALNRLIAGEGAMPDRVSLLRDIGAAIGNAVGAGARN